MHKDFHGNKLITGEKEKEGERGGKREFKCILVVVWNTVYLSEKREKRFYVLIWDYIHAVLQVE